MKTNFLNNLFYPPNYLIMPVAGVEICNSSVRYIEFSNKRGNLLLKNFGEIPFAEGVVKNGEILNKKLLIKALSELKNKISADFISTSISEEQTYMFYTQIPNLKKDADVRQAVEFKLEEYIPIKADEVSFEYHLLRDKKDMDGDVFVSVSAIPKKVIANYAEVFDLAGLTPLSFEIESRMAAKSVISKNYHKTSIIINIKDDYTTLSLVVDGNTRFTSTIAIGNNLIKQSLLKTDPSAYDASGNLSESLLARDATSGDGSFETLLNIFSIIKDEVRKFDEYLVSKASDKKSFLSDKIDQIVLCGKSSILPGLTSYISQSFSTEVVLANVWVNAFDLKDYIPNLKFQDSLGFTVPIGLVVNSLKNIKHA